MVTIRHIACNKYTQYVDSAPCPTNRWLRVVALSQGERLVRPRHPVTCS